MRFVPTNSLQEGMISGKRLIGKNNELLLNYGSVIRSSYIGKLKYLGYVGIYIDDELSNDIEVTDIINDSLRYKSIKAIKDVFNEIKSESQDISKESKEIICNMVSEILDGVLLNKNLMVNMIDLKVFDDYTYFHSVNVGTLSMLVGASMGLSKNQLYNLGLASMLHDIGKVFVPKEIIQKPGKLTVEEFDIIKTHSYKGYMYLKEKFKIPTICNVAVLDHHEKFNGSGYPNSRTGDEISLFGKIIAITDVYDSLTSERPYKKAGTPSEAIEYIMGNSHSHFDINISKAFLQKIAPYPNGTTVLLSNSAIGIVVENYPDSCLRPKVRIIKHGKEDVTPYDLDLRSNLSVTIINMANEEALSSMLNDTPII